jgi:predicted SprT family Zn-dependent metalloprotease
MKIPETFTLGPFKIPVMLKAKMWEKEEKVGTADIGRQRIILQSPMPGCFNRKCVEQAFLHELMHLLLFYAGQRELYEDEVLVDVLANLLYQFLETKEGDVLKKWKKNLKIQKK